MIRLEDLYVHKNEINQLIKIPLKDESKSKYRNEQEARRLEELCLNTHKNPKSFREDIIANVVIAVLLPELLPERIAPASKKELNWLKHTIFEKIKPALEKDKEIRVTYQKIVPYDKTYLTIRKNTSEKIETNFGAFRKRFDNLLKVYFSLPAPTELK